MGYLLQSGNKDDLLSLEFGVVQLNKLDFQERLAAYREFVYEVGALVTDKGWSIEPKILEKQQKKGFKISSLDHLKFRSRCFTDSAIIDSKGWLESYFTFCLQKVRLLGLLRTDYVKLLSNEPQVISHQCKRKHVALRSSLKKNIHSLKRSFPIERVRSRFLFEEWVRCFLCGG